MPRRLLKGIWNIEKPLLNKWAHQKGFKKQPYNQKRPPIHNIKQAFALIHQNDLKKPAKGHVRAYRKIWEHTDPFAYATKHQKKYNSLHPKLQAHYSYKNQRKSSATATEPPPPTAPTPPSSFVPGRNKAPGMSSGVNFLGSHKTPIQTTKPVRKRRGDNLGINMKGWKK